MIDCHLSLVPYILERKEAEKTRVSIVWPLWKPDWKGWQIISVKVSMVLFQWFGHKTRKPVLCQHLHSLTLFSTINLAMSLLDAVKTLGVSLDSKLVFPPHITNLCKSSFNRIRAIHHIRSALNKNMSQTSRLDYAHLQSVGLSDLELKRLQMHPKVLSLQSAVYPTGHHKYVPQSYSISCSGFL